jgi:hypothetical protein
MGIYKDMVEGFYAFLNALFTRSYNMDKNQAGTKFYQHLKTVDYTHEQIDARSERNENEPEYSNHKEVNETGRVWSFA